VVRSGEKAAADRAALEALVAVLPVARFDAEAAAHHGDTRAVTRERTRDAPDTLIAAHARAVENWVEGL
jgi:predicted nucleic acid-binding protein